MKEHYKNAMDQIKADPELLEQISAEVEQNNKRKFWNRKYAKIAFVASIMVVVFSGVVAMAAMKSSQEEVATTEPKQVENEEVTVTQEEANASGNETSEMDATAENTNTAGVFTDSTIFFHSAEEIIHEASIMVTGEVVETEGFVYSGDNGETFQVMTLVKVSVERDYLNQIPSGSEVYFVEPGGIVPTSEIPPRPEKDFNTTDETVSEYTQIVYNETPNSEVGQQVLFFADAVEDDFYNLNLGEPYYSAIGAEQSRFVLDADTNEYVRPLDEATGTNAPIVIENDEDELTSIADAK